MSHESFCLTTADKGLARICFGKADSLIDSLMFLSSVQCQRSFLMFCELLYKFSVSRLC